MSASTKRRQQLQAAREDEWQKNTSKIDEEVHGEVHGEAHWEGLTESEEESDVEFSDSDTDSLDGSKDAFERLVDAAKISMDSNNTSRLRYQRSQALLERQQRRVRAGQRSLTEAAKNHSQPIARLFQLQDPYPVATDTETANEKLSRAIADLEKKLSSKKTLLQGQNLVRHRAVLALLYTTQARGEGETREALSYQVARTFKKHTCFAKKLVEWEGKWIQERVIPEGKSGYHAKSSSWFNDEGVQLAVREWCAGAGERE